MTSGPPFRHTPYDGSSLPFTVGLKPITEKDWLEPDPLLERHLAEKERLFGAVREDVFQAETDTGAAQQEVLALVTDNLHRFHRDTHDVSAGTCRLKEAGRTVLLEEGPALMTASRLVQEDLVLMRAGPDGYRLAAASLCFPSAWSLREKFGRSMTGIHEGVPDFNGSRMGLMVARLFDNLQSGKLVCRFNWSIYRGEDLHQPIARGVPADADLTALARLFLRVERQTLRRLEGTGDILFTIKIHHDPLAALKDQDDRREIAAGLRRQLLDLTTEQMTYKGLFETRDLLAEALESCDTW